MRDRELESFQRKHAKEIGSLNERIAHQDNKEAALMQEIRESRALVSEIRSNMSGLEQLLCVKEDVNRQLDAMTAKV